MFVSTLQLEVQLQTDRPAEREDFRRYSRNIKNTDLRTRRGSFEKTSFGRVGPLRRERKKELPSISSVAKATVERGEGRPIQTIWQEKQLEETPAESPKQRRAQASAFGYRRFVRAGVRTHSRAAASTGKTERTWSRRQPLRPGTGAASCRPSAGKQKGGTHSRRAFPLIQIFELCLTITDGSGQPVRPFRERDRPWH